MQSLKCLSYFRDPKKVKKLTWNSKENIIQTK